MSKDNDDEEMRSFSRLRNPNPSLMSVHSIPMIRITDTDPAVRKIPRSPSLVSVPSIPMIRITDTDPTVPNLVRESLIASLGNPLEEDGVRVILNKRISDQLSIGFESNKSPISDQQKKRAANIFNINSKKSNISCKSFRRKLYAVIWINLLIRYRTKTITFLELFLPIFVLLIFISSLTSSFNWTVGKRAKDEMARRAADGKPYAAMNEQQLRKQFCIGLSGHCTGTKAFIAYTPKDKFTENIMKMAASSLGLNLALMKAVKDERAVLAFCKSQYIGDGSPENLNPIGIIFNNDYSNKKTKFPRILDYQIRTFTSEISNTAETFPYIAVPAEDHLISPYINSGFVGLQNAIDKAYVQIVLEWRKEQCACENPQAEGLNQDLVHLISSPDNPDTAYSLQMFPFSLYLDLKVRYYTWSSIMLAITLGYFCTTFFSVKQVIIDLNSGVLELFKLHGLVPYIHWLSLLFHDVILKGISSVFMTWIMFANVSANGGFFEYDDPFQVWLFFIAHALAKTSAGFFVAVFFTKPNFGGSFTFMISFLSYFIPINMYTSGLITDSYFNFVLCLLFPNWCLANGLYHFLKFESFEAGLTWKSSSVWVDEKYILFPISYCLVIFVFTTVMYMTLTIYVDRVSFKYLSPKEDYFFFLKCEWTKNFWPRFKNLFKRENITNCRKKKCFKNCFKKKRSRTRTRTKNVLPYGYEDDPIIPTPLLEELTDDFDKPIVYEDENLTCKVKCRHVTHYVGDSRVALDDVSLNFYEDQITIILGHSGCGKTTLLHTLAGLIKPSNGTTRVHSVDPAKNKQVRLYIGFCPQKLILFQTLSVEEHMRFACLLHSNSYKAAKDLSGKLLVRFNLWDVQGVGVKHLSECQKRKLAIAMAFTTNPPVLILDEPTYGMDPASRHEIWNCLKYLRQSRTIIVTTSTMDEADTYADKIVLLGKGKVVCFGSPSFLKKTYNTGSYIKLRKTKNDPYFANRITKYVFNKVDETIHEVYQKGFENQDNEVHFALPHESSHKYSKIIFILEEAMKELGITKISMKYSTLGGIFYKLSNEDHLGNESSTCLKKHSNHSQKIVFPTELPFLPPYIRKYPNVLLTISALLSKQISYIRQKHWMFIIEYLIPLILTIFFVRFCETYVASQPGPTTRPLNANTYPQPPIPILIQIYPNENVQYWKAAFDGVVGKTSDRIIYYDTSVEGKIAFQKKLKPVQESRIEYQQQVVTAYSRNLQDYIGFYASNALHSAPIAQNMLTNAILHLMSMSEDVHKNSYNPFRIITSSTPIPIYDSLPTGTLRDATNALAGVIFAFLLGLIAASRITFCIVERTSGIKSLQLMIGVEKYIYWSVIFVCDLFINFILSILIMGIICIFDTNNVFHGSDTKVTMFIIILLYLCWACLPFGYIVSRFIQNKHNAYGLYISFHVLLGSLPELIFYLLLRIEIKSNNFFNSIRYVFLMFPSFGITAAFVHFCEQVSKRNFCLQQPLESQQICAFIESNNRSTIADLFFETIDIEKRLITLGENDLYFHQCCKGYCKTRNTCFQSTPFFFKEGEVFGVSTTAIALGCQGILYWLLLLIMEYENFSWLWTTLKGHISGDLDIEKGKFIENETVEMHAERERINLIVEFDEPTTDAVVVADVTKFFGKKKVLEHIYFGIPKGAVIGILGPPQSGKTVLLRILTGDLLNAKGTVVINNIKLRQNRKLYNKKFSYCPQTNPILDYLTGYQMMELIARLRGIPISYIDINITKWLELMGFEKYDWSMKCQFYPPGMRRRLSFAMTLIGDCNVLIFDEPTWSLDPLEHLTFWNILTLLQKRNQTIIFTSSRAEECISITTKFIMLGHGQILEFGTPDEISERYVNGWTLMVRYQHDISQLGDERLYELITSLHEYINSVFSPCQVTDDQDSFLVYHVHDSVKTLSYMYEHMESAKTQLSELIDDYFIAEANLDDVIGNQPTYSNLYRHRSSTGTHSPLNIPGELQR